MSTPPPAPVLQPLPAGDTMALFRRLFEHSLEAVLLTRPQGEVLGVNPQACRMYGGDEATICARSRSSEGLLTLWDAADPRIAALRAQRLATGVARGPGRLRRLDGELFEAELSSFLFADEGGQPTTLLSIRDISALHAAERAARESDQRLGFALDAAGIGDWETDLATDTTRRSLRHDLCFGYTEPVPEWSHAVFLRHVHPDDRQRVDACYRAAMSGRGEYDIEFRVVWPDGSLHWLWSKGRFFSDDAGRPLRAAGIQVDVTERRRTDLALQQSEERLRLALRGSNDAPWDLDLRSGEPYYSPRWRQMLGYAADDAAASSAADGLFTPQFWWQLIHPDDRERVQRVVRQALDGSAQTYEIEFRMRHRLGHYLPVQSRAYILRDGQGRPVRVSGVNTDLTQRDLLLEAQRRQAVAESANAAKTNFLARMSHELRTPLNAVLGFAQLLGAAGADALSAAQQRQVQRIEQAGWHLLNMVDEILDLSLIDSGHARLHRERLALAPLLQEAADMVAAAAAERGIRLVLQPAAADAGLLADATRTRQVLLNLLSNAVKYTAAGGRVALAGAPDAEGRIAISVSDDGPGLAPLQLEQLFEPFNRLGQEAGAVPGTGIGLVISRRLAELMGGSLTVRSAPGQGSVFTLRLPAAPAAELPDVPGLREATPSAAVAGSRRVLYIEDDEVNAEVMRGMLRTRPGLALDVQVRAEDGLAAVRRQRPDLILLDMQLPDLPGLQVLHRLKRDPATADIPVIVVSASALADAVAAALAAGASRYLAKPFLREALLELVDRELSLCD